MDEAGIQADDEPIEGSVMLELLTRVRHIDAMLTDFETNMKPVLESVSKGGLMSLLVKRK